MNIRIGTRKSKLALWQAYYVQEKLEAAGASTEIVEIETKGDKILDVTIAKIGSKGVFTEEIEAQLKAGTIDIAVHSAKDMQSVLREGFEILAFTKREVDNDVLVSENKAMTLSKVASFTIGTSSTRRVALLKHYYPNIKTVDMRGNLQTRLQKLKAGHCDALILAYAGVHRMGYDDMITQHLSREELTPPVGQGSIAIETVTSLSEEKKELLKSALNYEDTAACLAAERAYLRKLEGGCSIPAFANAQLEGNTVAISGGIVSLDGSQIVRHKVEAPRAEADQAGSQLADYILAHGGQAILHEIRRQQA
ncbi:MAG: hydroxymethylbilane synthase [Cyclobacteriaceae bacterium]